MASCDTPYSLASLRKLAVLLSVISLGRASSGILRPFLVGVALIEQTASKGLCIAHETGNPVGVAMHNIYFPQR